MSRPLVDVILLNWHGAEDTNACLTALQKLCYENFRVVLVDNGSTDDSVARIRRAYPQQPIIETGKNLGFGGGCNVGMRHSMQTGAEYVWLLNNDTLPAPQALSAMVAVAEADPQTGAVGSILRYMDGTVQAWGGGAVNLWTGWVKLLKSAGRLDYVMGASILLKTEALREVGVFDEQFFMYWEDTDLSFRLRQQGWLLAVAEDSVVFHKESASLGARNPLLEAYQYASSKFFFNKHAVLPVFPIYLGRGLRQLRRLRRQLIAAMT